MLGSSRISMPLKCVMVQRQNTLLYFLTNYIRRDVENLLHDVAWMPSASCILVKMANAFGEL